MPVKTSNITVFQRSQIGLHVIARAVKKETEPQQLLATGYGRAAHSYCRHRPAEISRGFNDRCFRRGIHRCRGVVGKFGAGLQGIFRLGQAGCNFVAFTVWAFGHWDTSDNRNGLRGLRLRSIAVANCVR